MNNIVFINNQEVVFENKELGQVRTIKDKNNEPLFCLSDVCKILEIQDTYKVKQAILREFEIPTLSVGVIESTNNRHLEASFIDEPQLYYILNTSRSIKAKPFRMWVNKEVLPSIRKKGYYSFDNTPKLENYSKYNIPDTPYRKDILKSIIKTEKEHNCKVEELVSYKIVETYKNKKIHLEQKIHLIVKGLT